MLKLSFPPPDWHDDAMKEEGKSSLFCQLLSYLEFRDFKRLGDLLSLFSCLDNEIIRQGHKGAEEVTSVSVGMEGGNGVLRLY